MLKNKNIKMFLLALLLFLVFWIFAKTFDFIISLIFNWVF